MPVRDRVVLIYAVSLAIVVAVVACRQFPASFAPSGFIYQFQSLISGLLAIVAAIAGGFFVLNQTSQQERRDAEARTLTHRAVRTLLPHILSDVIAYSEECMAILDYLRRCADEDGVIKRGVNPPSLPTTLSAITGQLYQVLREGPEQSADYCAALQVALQIQFAQLEMHYDAAVGPRSYLISDIHNITSVAMLTAAIYARSEKLYDFARGKTDDAPAPLLNSDVISAFSKMEYYGSFDASFVVTAITARLNERWKH